MLTLLIAAASTIAPLPRHVGSPRPGQLTLAAGVEGRLPALDVRLPILEWMRLDVELDVSATAPLVAAELLIAADAPREALTAHAFFGLGLRPLFDGGVVSGTRFVGGFGLVGVWGALVASAEGGGAIGLSFNPVTDDDGIDPLAVDQQGGLYALQRLTLAYDLFDRVQVAGRLVMALPLNAISVGQNQDDAFPESEFRFGARVAVRF